MKISKTWIAATVMLVCAGSVNAQSSAQTVPQNTAGQNLQRLDNKTSGSGIRASKLMGMNIQNSRKENVGQIRDIVLDPITTRVQYVAVTYGGFLGLGDKMFAVPMNAIKVQQDPDNRERVVLVLDVTKEQMSGAQGFDEANWPNFSDAKFSGDLHQRYRVEDRWNNGARDKNIDVNIGRDGVKLNVDGIRK